MSKCLTPDEVERYVAGKLLATAATQLQQHLDACPQCQRAVEQEGLFGDLREAFASSESVADFEVLGEPPAPLLSAVELPQDVFVAAGYRVISEIHRGGQGIVYCVMQLATKRMVALKVLLAGGAASETQRQRFEREIDIAASLRHPNIVTIYDSGEHNGRQYLAMEYVDGQSLDHCMQNQMAIGKSVRITRDTLRSKLLLFHKIADAVGFAHTRGVLHRDLKPANIIVDTDGEPHVLDFGLAKLADAESRGGLHPWTDQPTVSGEFLGTLAYASPEQTRGDPQQIDIRSDVYSLGVILFEMLTGELPYEVSGTISEALSNICESAPKKPALLKPEIDDEVETILLKALSKEPARRYQSAEHFCRDIGHYLANEPIDAKRDSTWYLLRKSLKRYRWTLAVAASFFLVIAVSLLVSLASLRRAIVQRNLATAATAAAERARADELLQRIEAEAQRVEAEAQRAEAENQTAEAQTQRHEAEFQSYVANLAAAAGALRMFDVIEASSRLNATPPQLRGWEWNQLVEELDGSQATLVGSSSYVTDIAISPNRRWVAASGYSHEVYVWDIDSGELIQTLQGPARAAIAFSPDGKFLAIGWWNGQVRLWQLDSMTYSATLQGPSSGIRSLAFATEAPRLAAAFHPMGSDEQAISAWVWNLPDGELLQRIDRPQWHIEDLALSPDGTLLGIAAFDGVSLWDVDSGQLVHELQDQPGVEHCVAISHDGRHIASGGDDNLVHLWDANSGEHLRQFPGHGSSVLCVEFGANDDSLVSGSRDKTIRIWDKATSEQTRVLSGHQWGVSSLHLSHDGTQLASGSWDTHVKLWGDVRRKDAELRPGHAKQIAAIAFTPDGTSFATASWDQTIKLWDIDTRAELATLKGQGAQVHSLAFSPQGDLLLSGGWNGTLKLWDVATRAELATLEGHRSTARVHAVAFAPDGQWFVSGSSENELYIWDAQQRTRIGELSGHDDHIHSAVVSGNGRWIASAGHRTVRVWDAGSHMAVAMFPRTMVQDDFSLAFHPNHRWLAAGSAVGTITIWDVEKENRAKTLVGHSDEIHAVAFTPDGRRLVSAAFDNRVKIWDVDSGRELATLYGYAGHVNTLAFSPNGVYLVAGLDNGAIKIWRAASD